MSLVLNFGASKLALQRHSLMKAVPSPGADSAAQCYFFKKSLILNLDVILEQNSAAENSIPCVIQIKLLRYVLYLQHTLT